MNDIVLEDRGARFQQCQELQAPESKMVGTRSLFDAASSGKYCEIDTFLWQGPCGCCGTGYERAPNPYGLQPYQHEALSRRFRASENERANGPRRRRRWVNFGLEQVNGGHD